MNSGIFDHFIDDPWHEKTEKSSQALEIGLWYPLKLLALTC